MYKVCEQSTAQHAQNKETHMSNYNSSALEYFARIRTIEYNETTKKLVFKDNNGCIVLPPLLYQPAEYESMSGMYICVLLIRFITKKVFIYGEVREHKTTRYFTHVWRIALSSDFSDDREGVEFMEEIELGYSELTKTRSIVWNGKKLLLKDGDGSEITVFRDSFITGVRADAAESINLIKFMLGKNFLLDSKNTNLESITVYVEGTAEEQPPPSTSVHTTNLDVTLDM